MLLIVGLGNPGKEYERSRHNVGFMVLDALAKQEGSPFSYSNKFESDLTEATITFPGEKKHVRVLLAKPQTFMNKSGVAVAKLVNYYKLRTEDQVFVIHDDLDIEIGMTRIRLNGSSAGQKGVQSIIDHLGTDKFARFRMGIRPKEGQDKPAEEFVLGKFRAEEKRLINQEIKEVIAGLLEACDKGIIVTSI
jgi:PTH1 family peptidyl-tRNA hydrolase